MTSLDQGGLSVQHADQRFLVGADQATGAGAHLAGENGIASASCDQPGGYRLIAAVPLAGAEKAADRMGRGPERAEQPPQEHEGGYEGDERRHRDNEIGVVLLAFPDQRNLTGTIGDPGKAEAERQDEAEEEEDLEDGGHASASVPGHSLGQGGGNALLGLDPVFQLG